MAWLLLTGMVLGTFFLPASASFAQSLNNRATNSIPSVDDKKMRVTVVALAKCLVERRRAEATGLLGSTYGSQEYIGRLDILLSYSDPCPRPSIGYNRTLLVGAIAERLMREEAVDITALRVPDEWRAGDVCVHRADPALADQFLSTAVGSADEDRLGVPLSKIFARCSPDETFRLQHVSLIRSGLAMSIYKMHLASSVEAAN